MPGALSQKRRKGARERPFGSLRRWGFTVSEPQPGYDPEYGVARKAPDRLPCVLPSSPCLFVAGWPSVCFVGLQKGLPRWLGVLTLDSWLHWGMVVGPDGRLRRPLPPQFLPTLSGLWLCPQSWTRLPSPPLLPALGCNGRSPHGPGVP